ncbi:MAG: hypothetical protein ROO76_13305 [Terriglobia bacterium]|jgi:hypothetical protein|nr:hypothetical protein [Terriglobia bacterium]
MKKVELLVVFALFFFLCIPAYPQGEPPTSESTMNLSYPANFYVTASQTGTIGDYTLGGIFPTAMSYGCEVPELIGTTTYPNTSCVGTEGMPDSYDACLTKCSGLDSAATVERIYWQKDPVNKWQAGYNVSSTALPVNYIDWGDNLEGKTWPVQVIRVETNTFSLLPVGDSRTRMDMWHVFGQGTNELWGLHATDTETPKAYIYLDSASAVNWPYAVNVTAKARLNITKLESTSSACPVSGTGVSQSPYTPQWIFNPTSGTGQWGTAPVFQFDALYGAELNIKGSYVYGYNWNLRSMNTQGVLKPGWWRLTFYTSDDSIDFNTWLPSSMELGDTLAPPVDLTTTPVEDPGDIAALVDAKAEEGGDTGLPLYVPIVDKDNNLTYLDVCIKAGNAGGGGGKKGPR